MSQPGIKEQFENVCLLRGELSEAQANLGNLNEKHKKAFIDCQEARNNLAGLSVDKENDKRGIEHWQAVLKVSQESIQSIKNTLDETENKVKALQGDIERLETLEVKFYDAMNSRQAAREEAASHQTRSSSF